MLCRQRRFMKDETGQYKFGVERQMQNMPIQGTNADMTKRAMVEIDRKLEESLTGAGLVCQIHDELIAESPQPHIEFVIETMKTTMEEGLTWFGKSAEAAGKPNPFLLATGCSVDYEVQKAWGVTVKKCPHCGTGTARRSPSPRILSGAARRASWCSRREPDVHALQGRTYGSWNGAHSLWSRCPR